MNQTKKQTKKHRFNIVDFVLIMTVIACVIGIASRSELQLTLSAEEETAILTARISALKDDYIDGIAVGDTLFQSAGEKVVGKVLSIESTPAKKEYVNLEGVWVTTQYEDRVDLLCRLEVKGEFSEKGFMLNKTSYVGVGSTLYTRTSRMRTAFYILDIEKAE